MSFWTNQVNFDTRIHNDVSTEYTMNKRAKLYLFDENTKRILVFKPFIDSLSYSFEYKLLDNDLNSKFISGIRKTVDGITCKVSLGINLLASNIHEAKENIHKINEITKLIRNTPDINNASKFNTYQKKFRANSFGVYLSNLISNGDHDGHLADSSHIEIYNKALFGYIDDFKFDLSSKELGFFDVNKKLYPKQIKISFDLLVGFGTNYIISDKHVYLPFMKNSNYHSTDVQSWPFSIKSAPTDPSFVDSVYANNKHTWASFYNKKCPQQKIKFNLFLDSLSTTAKRIGDIKEQFGQTFYSKKYYTKKEYDFDFSFEVPSTNVAEARNNLFNFQKLIRVLNNFNDKVSNKVVEKNAQGETEFITIENVSGKTLNRIMVSNLINMGKNSTTNWENVDTDGVPCVINSFTFTPNLDMGMYDKDGFFIFKSFKLDFKCSATDQDNDIFDAPYNEGIATEDGTYLLYDNEQDEHFIYTDEEFTTKGLKAVQSKGPASPKTPPVNPTQTETKEEQKEPEENIEDLEEEVAQDLEEEEVAEETGPISDEVLLNMLTADMTDEQYERFIELIEE